MPPPGFILKDGALRNYNIMFDDECFPDEWIDLFIEVSPCPSVSVACNRRIIDL